MEEKTVLIPAISCGHCAATIKRELGDIEGVAAVEVDVATRKAHIRFSAPADWPKIRETLEDIGYPPAE
jgi:copper chaperone CopZ